MGDGIGIISKKLSAFKRRHYLSLTVRGTLLTLSLTLFYFLIATLLEYNLWLSGWARFTIFFLFFALVAFCIFRFLKKPLAWWLYKKGIGEEESARIIGSYFPSVKDRLLNVIQLSGSGLHTPLLEAGINQKSKAFENVSFESAIDLGEHRKLIKYFSIPLLLIFLILIVNRSILTQSTQRIVQFNREFSPQAPFKFIIANKNLNAFINEDFTLSVSLRGEAQPEAVYLKSNALRVKLTNDKPGEFSYTFEKIQNEIPFQLEASGFYSDAYTIRIINRPELTQLKMKLDFPRYLGRRSEELVNSGNLEIPEGTQIAWQITTANTTNASLLFSSSEVSNPMKTTDNQMFTFKKGFNESDQYLIDLENEESKNKDKITYGIDVIKDQYPQITVDHLKDSVLFKTVYLGGQLGDDYGITQLALNYQTVINGKTENKKINIPLSSNKIHQNFFYQWRLDSLHLEAGDKLNYYLQVWDNDGVNGHKSTKSATYNFDLPGKEEMKEEITKSQTSAENKIDQSLKKAKELRKTIDEAQQKLKGKETLDWQDKKMLEDLINQKENLDQMINEIQKQNAMLEQKKDALSEQDEKIREKSEQIQKLMDELLDDETKKLFQELEKLLKENSDISQMQKMLDKMNRKEINLEKELERTLELFKELQYDYKLDQAIQQIKEQTEKQEELLKKTEELANDKKSKDGKEKAGGEKQKENTGSPEGKEGNTESEEGAKSGQETEGEKLAEEQEKLTEELGNFEKTLEELEKMAEEMDKAADTPSDDDKNQVKDSQKESKESLKEGKPKKSAESQKKSISKMKEMKQQLEGMENSMEMEMNMENLEALRQIIHGLIKLSYDQESLMKDFNQVQQIDPKYIQLSQNQLKVKDDSKVLEDSLLALAKRDPFMGSVVTREVGDLNDHLDKAAEHIRERRKPNASSEMQLSMTSINNLALLLNDHFDMMMDAMANAKPGKGKGKKGNQPLPSLSKMQQKINEKIQELKNGGKEGRQYSEELAKMAAEQERIRRALQEMQEKLKKEGGKTPGGDLPGKMEQTEMDLVNKQITEQTLRRQKEILTRLLETEKSMREQNLDEERKGEAAKDYDKEIPRAFEEYLRLKEKEVELLKTVPPKLYPYYKKEVSEYFKRIENPN